jgi:nucleotide-binding universal stress UspA family protein
MNRNPADREEYGPAAADMPYERGTDGPRVIMVGLDGSAAAQRAGAYAGGLARRQHARLVVVFVAAPSAWTALAIPAVTVVLEETFRELAEEVRRQIRERAEELGLPVTFLCRRGEPAIELARVADEIRADMVVVGASRRGWHSLMGSVARRLVRTGHWPVLVVP